MISLVKKIFGTANERMLKKVRPTVSRIAELEPEMQALSAEGLRAKTDEFKKRLADGETLDDILPEAFAGGARGVAAHHRPAPLRRAVLGGIVLHQGTIAEMKTGEGKTLVATAAALPERARPGKGAHLVTVNDYLARRDVQWMGPIYHSLGLSVGVDHPRRELPLRPAATSPKDYRLLNLRPVERARRLPRRHHLRHQQRVRLRLPARQHEVHRWTSTSSASCTTPSSTRSTTS